jgi:hypothetical protein
MLEAPHLLFVAEHQAISQPSGMVSLALNARVQSQGKNIE